MADKNKSLQKLTVSPVTGLTPEQEQACIMLAAGDSISDVASKVGVARITLYQWRKTDVFQCYLNQQVEEVQENLRSGVLAMHRTALDTICDVMLGGSETARLRAAMWVIDKVEALQVEQTDIRESLRAQCTQSVFAVDDTLFDARRYREELKRRGLSDEG